MNLFFSEFFSLSKIGDEESDVVSEKSWKLSGTFSGHVHSLIGHENNQNSRKIAKLYSQLFLVSILFISLLLSLALNFQKDNSLTASLFDNK